MKRRHAEGIRLIGKGVYEIRLQRIDPRTGDPVDRRRRVRCSTEAEAVVARQAMIAEFDRADCPRRRVRLDEYAESWMLGKLHALKASTRRTYADALDRHILPDLGRYYIDAITPDDLRRWIAHKAQRYAPASANGFLRVLKTIMADAAEELDMRNPSVRIRAVPEDKARRRKYNILTADEMRRFLEALRASYPQWYAMVFTQFVTATRFGEVSALRWEDIDEEAGVIRIVRAHWRTIVDTTKTGDEHEVALTPELREVLRDWRKHLLRTQHTYLHSGWVFPSRVGKPHHSPSCMGKPFIRVLAEIDVDRRFASHGLRRTANDLLRRVATGEVTRAITGHVTAAMTERYSEVDVQEKATAVSRMLRLVHASRDKDGGSDNA